MAKNKVDDVKAVLGECSYEELKTVKGIVTEMIGKILTESIKIGTVVTIEGKEEKGKKDKDSNELTVYGVTADYYILKEGENVLKKKFTIDDFLSIDGREV